MLPNIKKASPKRQLRPLPKGLVNLYGLIAIFLILMPEWLAELALAIPSKKNESSLSMESGLWKKVPELHVGGMTMFELRTLAHELKIYGYSNQQREQLSRRLLKRLQQDHQRKHLS